MAVNTGPAEWIECIIESGAVVTTIDINGYIAFLYARRFTNVNFLKILTETPTNGNYVYYRGQTALMHFSWNRHTHKCVNILLKACFLIHFYNFFLRN